jgi:mono/diheme cytochrome c family protein
LKSKLKNNPVGKGELMVIHFDNASRASSISRLLAFVFIAATAGAAACSGNQSNKPSSTTPQLSGPVIKDTKNPLTDRAAAAGQPLYAANCAFCHGADGKGDNETGASLPAKPPDLTMGAALSNSDGEIFLAIRDGKMKDGKITMPPAKKLTDEQIWQIVAYVRTLAEK